MTGDKALMTFQLFMISPIALRSVICFLLFSACCHAGIADTIYTSTLTGAQILEGKSYSVGNSFCILLRGDSKVEFACELQHNVTNPNSAYIARGSRGEFGPTLYTFNIVNTESYLTGNWNFVDQTNYTIAEQVEEFLSGRFYIVVASENNVGGIARGQLEQSSRFYARLDADSTIPLASGTTSSGIATATYSPTSPARKMSLTIVHNVDRPTGMQLRSGAANQVGSVLYDFTDPSNQSHNSVQLSVHEEDEIFEDLLYLNIASRPNPTGDIRGQIHSIDYIAEGAFTALLSGDQVEDPIQTDTTGCAIVSYDCNTKILEYLVIHNANDIVTDAIIGFGKSQEPGTILDSLPTSTSPIFGSIRLNNAQVHALYTDQMFFQIYAQGRPFMRGTLTSDWDFFVYLSGSNELPSVSSAGKGCGLARLLDKDDEDVLLFTVHHTVKDPLSLDIRRGADGISGPAELVIDEIVTNNGDLSPIIGELVMDDDDLEALHSETFYFEMPTATHLTGEVRGQLRRIKPCKVEGISYSVEEETSVNVFSYFQSIDASRFSGRYNIIYDSGACFVVSSVLLSFALLVLLI